MKTGKNTKIKHQQKGFLYSLSSIFTMWMLGKQEERNNDTEKYRKQNLTSKYDNARKSIAICTSNIHPNKYQTNKNMHRYTIIYIISLSFPCQEKNRTNQKTPYPQ